MARLLFAFFACVSIASVTVPSTAHAQWICSVSPDIFCQNSTDQTGAGPFTQTAIGTENVTLINLPPGIADGMSAETNDGRALSDNRGTVNGLVVAVSNNGGNATAINSGIALALSAVTNNGGNASATNSGNILTAITANAVNGNSTVTNTASGQTTAIITQAQGGAATSNNFGNVLVSIQTNTFFGDATTVNSGTVQNLVGPGPGIDTRTDGSGNATTTNLSTGTVNGGVQTISGNFSGGGDASFFNFGKVNGDVFVSAVEGQDPGQTGNATFVNAGSITPTSNGITVKTTNGDANFRNSGAINLANTFGGLINVYSFNGSATAYNSGQIFGAIYLTAGPTGTATFTNAGLIDGTSAGGVAINLAINGGGIPSTLNILPGSRIVGEIFLAGALFGPPPTTVNIFGGADISSVLKFGCRCTGTDGLFDTGAPVNVFGGAPYVIDRINNTVAILDPTSFAVQDRNVADVARTISSLVSGRLTNPAPVSGGTTAIGFAPSGNVAVDMARDAFAGISSLGYAAQDRVLLGNPSMTAPDGTSIWAQGFGGRRVQSAEAPTLRSVNNFYGGAMGMDKAVRPDLRVGGFIGAGAVKSNVAFNSGDTTSDMVFGGFYGRYTMNSSFIDVGLLGGHSANSVTRTMANNLAPGGFEYASAKYNGWFISPEVAYGVQKTIAPNWTLTPTARVRYLAAEFGGYQESGATTNLTVASRVSHNFEERGEVTLAHVTRASAKERLVLSGTLGALAMQRAGSTTVNTVLLGQSLAFATPGKDNVFGVTTGGGFDWRHTAGVSVFGAAEFTAMTDSSRTLTGKGGVRYAF